MFLPFPEMLKRKNWINGFFLIEIIEGLHFNFLSTFNGFKQFQHVRPLFLQLYFSIYIYTVQCSLELEGISKLTISIHVI